MVNPVLYNGEALQTPADVNVRVAPQVAQGGESTLAQGLAGSVWDQQGSANRMAASTPTARTGEVAEAAASQWVTTNLFKAITAPTYAKDDAKPADILNATALSLTTDEMDYFQKGNGTASYLARLETIKQDREASAVASTRPGLAMLVAGIDPALLVLPGASAVGVARVGGGVLLKAAAAGAVGTGTSLAAGTQRPMSTTDHVLNGVLEAIAAPLVTAGKARKVMAADGTLVDTTPAIKVDPDFPSEQLQSLAKGGKIPEAVAPTFGAHAVGEAGDITVTASAQVPGEFQVTHFSEGVPVHATSYPTKETATKAFKDAVVVDNAAVVEHPWNGTEFTLVLELPKKAKKSKKVKEEIMYEDVGIGPQTTIPPDLTPGVVHTAAASEKAVDVLIQKEAATLSQKVGETLQWNIRKTMAKFGEVHREVSELLFDNNSDLSKTSVESHIRAAQVELQAPMTKFNDQLSEAMAEHGYGFWKQIFSTKAAAVQRNLEKEVSLEMLRRSQYFDQGRTITHEGIPKHVKDMADTLSLLPPKALDEMQAAGVVGVEGIKPNPYYSPRRWDSLQVDTIINKIMAVRGVEAKVAKKELVELVAKSMANANKSMAWQTAWDVAHSTIDRALRKGRFEDDVVGMAQGADVTARTRDMLTAEGLTGQRLQRVMDVLVGKRDEAGKASFLKHRVDMDYTATIQLGDEVISVTDLFNHNIKGAFDKYVSKTSAEIGFARKGLGTQSDIHALRQRGIEALAGDVAKQTEFKDLFDNSIAHMFGEASGSDVGVALRNTAAFNRLVTLGSSGYWQVTEYAKMMQEYGALKTIKYMAAEMPGFKHMLETVATDKTLSTHLKDILTFTSESNLRMQPYVERYADGFAMPANSTVSARLQHSTQIVPYLNGMKYIHTHQARVTANLIIDCINRAVAGDAKMITKLEKYGLDAERMAVLKSDTSAVGMDVSKWSDDAWQKTRPVFMKMMDESVLHARLGDTPAFALLNPIGKFICTYRSFVVTAHNKLLAGTASRDGLGGLAQLMIYQYPLSALAVQAQASINGKKPLTTKELATLSIGQMGSMGAFSEVFGVLSGSKTQLGSPGLIPFDRAYAAVGEFSKYAGGKGNGAQVAHSLFNLTPFLSVLPPAKAMEALAIKEMKEDQPRAANAR